MIIVCSNCIQRRISHLVPDIGVRPIVWVEQNGFHLADGDRVQSPNRFVVNKYRTINNVQEPDNCVTIVGHNST